ncbi:DUF7344 domain-containing protein [Halogeometricum luteum]|uniref:Helix-turn-helix domain-containing protein n=1 Tax=Halogeometricum luteum TaxID=2950537 RepID=A0ABU2G162_9EURY|nr:hypothetical protein [Halogeometricum sp. S3BR5-2]MDS0294231.1 helix-turn-helix domain-containing protein [Halogeometricum sp. S3BR5-2]
MSGADDRRPERDSDRVDERFEALSNASRRRILLELLDREPLRIDADLLGDDAPPGLRAELYHVHLPKLRAAGFIEWDREEGLVRRGGRFDALVPLLRFVRDDRDDRSGQ